MAGVDERLKMFSFIFEPGFAGVSGNEHVPNEKGGETRVICRQSEELVNQHGVGVVSCYMMRDI